MKTTLHLIFFAICLFFAINAQAQSPYFFKTIETLNRESSDAVSSGQTSISAEISKEIDKRNEEKKKIEQLQADINKKIEVEDYFGAQSIKEEMEKLKAKQAKADDLRKKIEAALAIEDYGKADQFKTELINLNNPGASAQKQETKSNEIVVTNQSGFSSNSGSGFTTPAGNNSNQALINSLSATGNNSGFQSSGSNTYTQQKTSNQLSYDEMLRKCNKYKRRGTFSTIFGPICLITGVTLFTIGISNKSYDSYYGYYDTDPLPELMIPGGLLIPFGIIHTIGGPAMLGRSRYYKRKMDALGNNTSFVPFITPTYNKTSNSWGFNTGVGFKYNF